MNCFVKTLLNFCSNKIYVFFFFYGKKTQNVDSQTQFLAMKEKQLRENQLEPIILETIILFSCSHSF